MACRGRSVAFIRFLGDSAIKGATGAYLGNMNVSLQSMSLSALRAARPGATDQLAQSAADISQAERTINQATSKPDLVSALRAAERALANARKAGRDKGSPFALERRVEQIRLIFMKRAAELDREASVRYRPSTPAHLDLLAAGSLGLRRSRRSPEGLSAPCDTIDAVLEARTIEVDVASLIATAMNNPRVSAEVRDELPSAMAKVQDISSHAPGLATETINGLRLGRSSPPGSGATLWVSTVASRGQANGFAYEIAATARFIDAPRISGNGGPPVQIVKGRDELIFGAKLPARPDGGTVEADTLVVRSGGHRIGIDAKAYARPLPTGGLPRQLAGLKYALSVGEIHEYHFASKGSLSDPAKKLIEQADSELRAELTNRTPPKKTMMSDYAAQHLDLSKPLICWHENLG